MDYKEKCICFMSNVLGYERSQLIHTYFFAKLEELHRGWNYEIIYEAMKYSEETIRWALSEKTFTSDKNVISYVMSIIGNNIGQVARDKKIEELMDRTPDHFTAEDNEMMEELDSRKNYTQNTTDISKWL